jgi:hypothetical protein
MTERRSPSAMPLHVGVLLGVSAGSYALMLAGVAGLQSAGDAQLAADRAPLRAAIDDLVSAHDRLTDTVNRAGQAYEQAAAAYDATGSQFTGLESVLGDLAGNVSAINGAAKSLPASAPMPKVSRSVGSVSAPTTQATTGASGKP